jgi:hypothetical protein
MKMANTKRHTSPKRGPEHEALAVFLGEWRAEGTVYGGPEQSRSNPKGSQSTWVSTHTGMWHTGEFFLIQDERAITGDRPFDTLSIMGFDVDARIYFARSFENHGFYRHYDVTVDDRLWTISGETERARIEFSPDGKTQTISWEWRPDQDWLPLCDRVATKM